MNFSNHESDITIGNITLYYSVYRKAWIAPGRQIIKDPVSAVVYAVQLYTFNQKQVNIKFNKRKLA